MLVSAGRDMYVSLVVLVLQAGICMYHLLCLLFQAGIYLYHLLRLFFQAGILSALEDEDIKLNTEDTTVDCIARPICIKVRFLAHLNLFVHKVWFCVQLLSM